MHRPDFKNIYIKKYIDLEKRLFIHILLASVIEHTAGHADPLHLFYSYKRYTYTIICADVTFTLVALISICQFPYNIFFIMNNRSELLYKNKTFQIDLSCYIRLELSNVL